MPTAPSCMKFRVSPSAGLAGQVKVPADKSISHRAVILGAISRGITRVSNILEGEDVLSTIRAFQNMGVSITRLGHRPEDNHYEIHGVGLHGLQQPESGLDMGNSGTAFRLLAGLLCAQPWPATLTGDGSLSNRPMGRIVEPLGRMGARIESREGKPPLRMHPVARLHPIRYTTPMASAQVKSAVLLAGLYARGRTTVTENAPTRDHTERMLRGFGCRVEQSGRAISVHGGGALAAQDIEVPADLSSATFFMLAGLLCRNSELWLHQVGMNPSRNGVIRLFRRMGGSVSLINESVVGCEPVADIVVRTSHLKGIEIGKSEIALSIDEIPAVAVAAACATGVTRISQAEELRVKESDRIHSIVRGLRALGVEVMETHDGMVIQGGGLSGGRVDSFGDHRIAMAFAIAGAAASGPVEIRDCSNVATSFPGFPQLAAQIGVDLVVASPRS
ncbi:MAG: 3-phosphoshikimate 1-carboxyvinyltransferase [Gammaproteobacteria bacterium]|nr:3-phosphoshikimate 1-carboxyvinyltransferase [Gammaproteobacteria bacterium]